MTDDIHRRIAGLSPDKRAKLEQRLIRGALEREPATERGSGPPQLESLDRRALSSAQKRLWFLDRLDPGDTRTTFRSHGACPVPLDVAALETSLNEIVRRHEVLRTTFREDDGQPTQDVAASCALRLAVRDSATCRRRDARRGRARWRSRSSGAPSIWAAGR